MDILKIRKKKRDEAAAPEAEERASEPAPTPPPAPARTRAKAPSSPSPSSPSSPSPSPSPSPPPSSSAPSSQPPPARPPPPPSSPPPVRAEADAEGASRGKRAKPQARPNEPLPPAVVDDPLLEFLARYDEGAAQTTVGVTHDAQREESKRYLAFELAGEEYAASIMEIREILRVLALTAVPRAPREILGVISKRGLVMPVVDLAATLGLREPDRSWSPRQRILVVGEADRVCGLRVDRVLEVVRLRATDVEEVPASLGARSKHQLRGLGRVGERMFILLDVGAVLHSMAVAAGLEAREEAS